MNVHKSGSKWTKVDVKVHEIQEDKSDYREKDPQ